MKGSGVPKGVNVKKTKLSGESIKMIIQAIRDIEADDYYNYSYTGYRFNKISNVLTHKQHKIAMILRRLDVIKSNMRKKCFSEYIMPFTFKAPFTNTTTFEVQAKFEYSERLEKLTILYKGNDITEVVEHIDAYSELLEEINDKIQELNQDAA